jgi:hypothetical protein
MKNLKKRFILLILACFCFPALTGCDGITSTSSYNKFNYDLQGTWTTADSAVYYGTLEIEYNTIKISGYGEEQTLWSTTGNDNERPFREFTKDTFLESYSEESKSTYDLKEGKIFIKNAGDWNEGIPYTYFRENSGRDEFLRFNFNGRRQELRKDQ